MPIPLIAIISALTAGGTLVPHAAGGMIVTAATGGYIAGTYISTASIASLLATATATIGIGAAIFTGKLAAIIGGAGIFGTTIGATGITGALMSAGILPSTPIVVPILAGSALVGFIFTAIQIFKLKRKVKKVPSGQEIQFTEMESKTIEAIIKLISKKNNKQDA
jgi:hypothetical protein